MARWCGVAESCASSPKRGTRRRCPVKTSQPNKRAPPYRLRRPRPDKLWLRRGRGARVALARHPNVLPPRRIVDGFRPLGGFAADRDLLDDAGLLGAFRYLLRLMDFHDPFL